MLWKRRKQTLDHMSDAQWGETTMLLRVVYIAVAIEKLHHEC